MSINLDKSVTDTRFAIIGAGDLGYSMLRLTQEIPHLDTIGFFVNTCHSDKMYGIPILGVIDSIEAQWRNKTLTRS